MTRTKLLSRIHPTDRQVADQIINTNWPGQRWFSTGHLVWLNWFLGRYK